MNHLAALSLVPPKEVNKVYSHLIASPDVFDKNDRNYSDVRDFLDYFERTWVGRPHRGRSGKFSKPLFNIKMWNWNRSVIQGRPCTNNCAESWHNAIRGSCKKHERVPELIEFLKKESSRSIIRMEQYRNSGEKNSSKFDTSDKFKRILSRYDTYDDKIVFLRYIAIQN